MQNKDMPAMPTTITMSENAFRQATGCGMSVDRVTAYTGLTKREAMAIEFTKANIIGVYSSTEVGEFHHWNFDDFSREGLGQADSLLAALGQEQ